MSGHPAQAAARTQASHQAPPEDRRRHPRHPFDLDARIAWDGQSCPAALVDLSVGGALLVAAQDQELPSRGIGVVVEAQDLGSARGQIVALSRKGLHLQIVPDDQKAAARALAIQGLKDLAAGRIVRQLAADVANGWASGRMRSMPRHVDDGATGPAGWREPHAIRRTGLSKRLAEAAWTAPRALFACAIDRDAYVRDVRTTPGAQLRSAVLADVAIAPKAHTLADHAGLRKACTNLAPVLHEDRRLDLCGTTEALRIRVVSAPVVIDGRHWGCVAVGFDRGRSAIRPRAAECAGPSPAG